MEKDKDEKDVVLDDVTPEKPKKGSGSIFGDPCVELSWD
jgi:hypothetical protein